MQHADPSHRRPVVDPRVAAHEVEHSPTHGDQIRVRAVLRAPGGRVDRPERHGASRRRRCCPPARGPWWCTATAAGRAACASGTGTSPSAPTPAPSPYLTTLVPDHPRGRARGCQRTEVQVAEERLGVLRQHPGEPAIGPGRADRHRDHVRAVDEATNDAVAGTRESQLVRRPRRDGEVVRQHLRRRDPPASRSASRSCPRCGLSMNVTPGEVCRAAAWPGRTPRPSRRPARGTPRRPRSTKRGRTRPGGRPRAHRSARPGTARARLSGSAPTALGRSQVLRRCDHLPSDGAWPPEHRRRPGRTVEAVAQVEPGRVGRRLPTWTDLAPRQRRVADPDVLDERVRRSGLAAAEADR